MTTSTWIALIIAVTSALVAVAALIVARTARARTAELESRMLELESSLDKVGPLIADTRSALRKAESRIIRADDLVQAATAMTTRADHASKVAYEVATNPVVRVMAWGRGVRRGVAALRGRSEGLSIAPSRPTDVPVPTPQQLKLGHKLPRRTR